MKTLEMFLIESNGRHQWRRTAGQFGTTRRLLMERHANPKSSSVSLSTRSFYEHFFYSAAADATSLFMAAFTICENQRHLLSLNELL